MKQNITLEQLKELNDSQIIELEKNTNNSRLANLRHINLSLVANLDEIYLIELSKVITIGKIIEILENNQIWIELSRPNGLYGNAECKCKTTNPKYLFMTNVRYGRDLDRTVDYVDALWEAVKTTIKMED